MKGISVSVLREAMYTGQPHQFTEQFNRAVLIHPRLPQLFEATPDHPALFLVEGNLGPGHWKAVPWFEDGVMVAVPDEVPAIDSTNPHVLVGQTVWAMFGGHYVTTSDSRLGEVIGRPAVVPVHDRVER